jgi:hypothetical protein
LALAVQAETVHDKSARAAWRSRQDSLVNMVGRIIGGLAEQKLLRPGRTVEEASEWVCLHLDPVNYHAMVTLRGWKPERLKRRIIDSIRNDLLVTEGRPQ